MASGKFKWPKPLTPAQLKDVKLSKFMGKQLGFEIQNHKFYHGNYSIVVEAFVMYPKHAFPPLMKKCIPPLMPGKAKTMNFHPLRPVGRG